MTNDDTDEYQVSRQQGGRGAKPVYVGRDGEEIEAVEPGETFTVPAGTDLSAFEDRVVPAEQAAEQAHANAAAPDDAGPPDDAGKPDDAGPPEDAGKPDHAGGDESDAESGESGDESDANDGGADDPDGPVQPDDVAERLGYDDASNVDEVRALVSEADLSDREKRALVRYEQDHEDRKTAVEAIKGA